MKIASVVDRAATSSTRSPSFVARKVEHASMMAGWLTTRRTAERANPALPQRQYTSRTPSSPAMTTSCLMRR